MKTRPLVFLTLATSFAVGCVTPMSAVRDDNKRLSDAVAELRADRRTQNRKLEDLQHELDLARAKQLAAAADAAPPPPNLPVEVVAPTSSTDPRVVAVTDDGTEIVYEGDAAAGKPATFDDRDDAPPPVAPARRAHAPAPAHAPPSALAPVPTVAADDRLEVTAPNPRRAARPAPAPSRAKRDLPGDRTDSAANDYRAAVELVKTGPFTDAVAALHAFIQKYPHHDYADNAQYWLGEAFYAQKDYAHALGEFRTVIETYPRGNKVPDALLKVGYCYAAMGQADKAKAVLEQVVTLYPKSEPAALAAKRLEATK